MTIFFLALTNGILAFAAVWLAFGPLSPIMLIWPAAIGWACYAASGGGMSALTSTIVGFTHGVAWAWLVQLLIIFLPIPSETLVAPFWVGVAIFAIVLAGRFKHLANVPAGVLGFACVIAYMVQTPNVMNVDFLTQVNHRNLLVYLPISAAIGAALGHLATVSAEFLSARFQPAGQPAPR